MSDPRKVNLSLPADYISKPAEKLRQWLRANTASLRSLGESEIVAKARAALGPQIGVLNDGDLAAMTKEWVKENGIQLPGTAAGPGPGESEIVARLKKLFASIPTSVSFKWSGGAAVVSVSGATLQISSGRLKHSVGAGWGGSLEFKTQAPGVAFTVSMGEKDWRMTMAFGKLAPNLGDLESVFKKGEAALRGALGSLDKVDWKNPSKTKQVFAPYLDPIKSAVDAASKSANLKAGDASLGAWVGSGPSGGVAGGIQLTILF